MIRLWMAFCVMSLTTVGYAADINYDRPVPGRWSKERANAWYAKQPWLVGCNYYPATAINQIEMWQASTWDPKTIDKELELASSIGMNTLRVYLHDLVWADDEKGLYKRMDEFLTICQKHGIRPFFVFFDDCHYPEPKLGPQPLPVKGWHNSGWRNCPARDVALRFAEYKTTEAEEMQLKGYVQKTMTRFKDDPRVLCWELYNEPGRGNGEDMANQRSRTSIGDKSNRLVYMSWVWAREVNPSQPICSNSAGSVGKRNIAINRINSDFHSIHSYSPPERLRALIHEYKKDGRPILVTEWLARTKGSTVAGCLPVLKEENVGAVNWGFVSGKSGTIWPWSSRRGPNGKPASLRAKREAGEVVQPGEAYPEPEVWFHDLFRPDHTPYDPAEIAVFRKLTNRQAEPEHWGTIDGKAIHRYTLTNRNGLVMRVTNYGAIITELHAPDRDGERADIVLGYDSLDGYIKGHPYFGAIVGRDANRIAGGRFSLAGKTYQLACNNGPNHLHGGVKGFDKHVWDATPIETDKGPALKLTRVSVSGEENYPGNLSATVVYTLTHDNELITDVRATTDATTLCDIAQHSYWNLAGHASGTIRDHVVQINADGYTPVNDALIPTGKVATVAGTPFDFRKPKKIGEDLLAAGGDPIGFDHNFAVNGKPSEMKHVATVHDPASGRTIKLFANQPGVQFYTGNFLDGTNIGKGDTAYHQYNGFCLETQTFPDAIHQPTWQSPVLRPGEVYRHVMITKISVQD